VNEVIHFLFIHSNAIKIACITLLLAALARAFTLSFQKTKQHWIEKNKIAFSYYVGIFLSGLCLFLRLLAL